MSEVTGAGSPLVSVVIVNFNGEELLGACLESVFGQRYQRLEVIVVDNGSTDGSLAIVRGRFPVVRILALGRNEGFAGGSNRGVEAALGDFVLLLNNDTVVEEGWVEGLLEAAGPGVGAVTSKVMTEGVPPALYAKNGSVNYLGYNIMEVFTDLSQVFFAGGASLLFRRKPAELPFLDEYFLYMEDVYFSWRLRLQGLDIRMAQSSLVRHRGSATTGRHPSSLVTFYQERNRLLNSLIFYETFTLLRLLPYFILDAAAKTVLSLAGRYKPLSGILRAYLWIAFNAGVIRKWRAMAQSKRVVHDKNILLLMSSNVVTGRGAVAQLINGLSRAYATLVRLPHV